MRGQRCVAGHARAADLAADRVTFDDGGRVKAWRSWLPMVVSFVALAAASFQAAAAAPPPPDPLEGEWLAADPDARQSTRSVIRIQRREGRLFGRIVRTLDADGREIAPACEHCLGDLKGRAYTDIEFIRDLKPGTRGWTGGTVIDLRPGAWQGTIANCELSLKGDKAVLLGYIGMRWLGRTSVWERLPRP
ncbi:DUF2147 domain-containing protein [Leptothrix sp. BB-4]